MCDRPPASKQASLSAACVVTARQLLIISVLILYYLTWPYLQCTLTYTALYAVYILHPADVRKFASVNVFC